MNICMTFSHGKLYDRSPKSLEHCLFHLIFRGPKKCMTFSHGKLYGRCSKISNTSCLPKKGLDKQYRPRSDSEVAV